MTYVYTKKAELKALELNLESRKEGSQAYFAGMPITYLTTTTRHWLNKGYIKAVEQ